MSDSSVALRTVDSGGADPRKSWGIRRMAERVVGMTPAEADD